jgi:hypothetical protein
LIPAEDVIRTIEEAAATVADAAHAEGERKLQGLHDLANQIMDEKQRRIKTLEHNYREHVRTGGRLLHNVQVRADRQTKRAVQAVVAVRAQLKKAREQPSFAEAIATHVNSGENPRHARHVGRLVLRR